MYLITYVINHNNSGLCYLHHMATSGLIGGLLEVQMLLSLCYIKASVPQHCCLSPVVLKKCVEALLSVPTHVHRHRQVCWVGWPRYQAPLSGNTIKSGSQALFPDWFALPDPTPYSELSPAISPSFVIAWLLMPSPLKTWKKLPDQWL